jgi:hypothetical protein
MLEFAMSNARLIGISTATLHRTGLRVVCIVLAGMALAACDKCGNSIFRAEAGPLACRDQAPH